MSTHDGFIQAIRETPADDTPRLIYADWLDEHDASARAEFIRVQCELARTPFTEDRWDVLKAREDELLAKYRTRWRAPLRGVIRNPNYFRPEFSRGFVECVKIVPLVWLRFGADLLRAEPIHSVEFESTVELANALVCPELAKLDSLSLRSTQIDALLGSPYTGRLRELSIWVETEDLRALFNSPLYLQLQNLDLPCAKVANVRMLVEGPVSGRLRHLAFYCGRIQAEGMNLLAAWPGLKHVTSLGIGFNYSHPGKTQALFASPYLEALEELYLHEMDLTDDELLVLASSHVRRLRVLLLDGNNDLTLRGIEALVTSPIVGQLTTLWLDVDDPREVEALAASSYLSNLRELHLSGQREVMERGAEALLASPYLGRKHRLLLNTNPLPGELGQRLCERFTMAPPYAKNKRNHLCRFIVPWMA